MKFLFEREPSMLLLYDTFPLFGSKKLKNIRVLFDNDIR